MVTGSKKRKSTGSKKRFIGKPTGQIQERVQAIGPEHFGIVAVDCAKRRQISHSQIIGHNEKNIRPTRSLGTTGGMALTPTDDQDHHEHTFEKPHILAASIYC